MINSGILDIVIGLVFIYLLYSLLVTIVQEIIASNFGFRAKILERAIFRMLEDENKFNNRFASVFYLFKKSGNGGKANSTSGEFYRHPLIKFLGEDNSRKKPAYINSTTFSKVIVDLLRGSEVKPGDDINSLIQKALDQNATNWGNSKISDETLSFLKSIWADSQGDIGKFRRYLESWFNETMDRASSWYKKHTQFILFFVGLTIAIIFNVDTIKIVDKLESDPKLREQLVLQANAFVQSHPDLDVKLKEKEIEYQKAKTSIQKTDSIIDANSTNAILKDSLELENYKLLKAKRDTLLNQAESLIQKDLKNINHSLGLEWEEYDRKSGLFVSLLKSLFGWIITAIALSMGAPFWFDLLNKLMKLRGSVATPTSDDKEKKQG